MLEIKTFEVGSFGTNMYLVSDDAGNILLIDPACSSLYEQQMLLRYVNTLPFTGEELCSIGLPVAVRRTLQGLGFQILATHGHLDHLWGAAWACEQWHTPVLMHEADIPMAKAMQAQYDLFGIGGTPVPFPLEPLPLNPSIHHSAAEPRLIPSLKILSTPGHTPGSVCFYFPEDKVLFSGDTLFKMGYGRTDLPGGDIQQLWHSLDLLLALPPETVVYPGHGAPTTIAAERRRW